MTLYDVTLVSNLRADVVMGAAQKDLFAAGVAMRSKDASHRARCAALGYAFRPMVFESGGATCEVVSRMVNRCSSFMECRQVLDYTDLAVHNTWSTPTALHYWRQRLSCCLMRWVARQCLRVRSIQRRRMENRVGVF